MSVTKCPFVRVDPSDLVMVKPEFRNEITEDAEKCIKYECSAYYDGKCNNETTMLHTIKLGPKGYQIGGKLSV